MSIVPKRLVDQASNTELMALLEPPLSNGATMIFRSTTGYPPTGKNGWFCLNIYDATLLLYVDDAWREIASWATTGLQFPLHFPLHFV